MRKHEGIRQRLQEHFDLKPNSKEFNELVRKFAHLFENMSKNVSISETFTNLDSFKPNHFNVRIMGMGTLERNTFYYGQGFIPESKAHYTKAYTIHFELFNVTDDSVEHPWAYPLPQVFNESEIKYMGNFGWKEDDFLDVINHIRKEFDYFHEMIENIESYGWHFFGYFQGGDFAFGRLIQKNIDDHHDLFAELELEHGEMTARFVQADPKTYFNNHRDWMRGRTYRVEKGDFHDAILSFEKDLIPKRLGRDTFLELNSRLRDAIMKLETPLRFTGP